MERLFAENKACNLKKRIKLIGINLLVLVVLLAIVEGVLRYHDFPIGYIPDTFDPPSNPVYSSPYFVDSTGVHSMNECQIKVWDEYLFLNEDGFNSPYEFTAEETAGDSADHLRVLLLGDSYAMGFDSRPLDSSFANILDRKPELKIYNTGIQGMDLVQYRLVLEKYLDIIEPDLVLVSICLENDIAIYEREPRPGIPIWVQVEGFLELATEVLDHGEVVYFDSEQEVMDWYVQHYTLLGPDQSLIERWLGKTALGTNIYLPLRLRWSEKQNNSRENKEFYTKNELQKLIEICETNSVPLKMFAIPSKEDAVENLNLEEKYGFVFSGLDVVFPKQGDFVAGDYSESKINTHFNNHGHRKFAEIVHQKLSEAGFLGQIVASASKKEKPLP